MASKSKILNSRQTPAILTRKRKAVEIREVDCNEENSKKRTNHLREPSCNCSESNTKHNGNALSRCDGEGSKCTKNTQTTLVESLITSSERQFQQLTCSSIISHSSPLPPMSWVNAPDLWEVMVEKDNFYQALRECQYHLIHPSLQPRMRAILLDWLIEVCEVYRLQRETYYLAMDFLDRYFAKENDIQKQQLQLIGITCLFVAAKFEEIYPAKLHEFAYVTDGACSEKDILDQEIILLKVLDWDLVPLTVVSWLNTFIQLSNLKNIPNDHDSFVYPQYSGHFFYQIAQVLDLCMMDVVCLQFPYRIIAATAIYFMTSLEKFNTVTGLKWDEISNCVAWMAPFVMTLKESGFSEMKFFQDINSEDVHNIAVHSFDLTLLDKALEKQSSICNMSRSSPVIHPAILTPPKT